MRDPQFGGARFLSAQTDFDYLKQIHFNGFCVHPTPGVGYWSQSLLFFECPGPTSVVSLARPVALSQRLAISPIIYAGHQCNLSASRENKIHKRLLCGMGKYPSDQGVLLPMSVPAKQSFGDFRIQRCHTSRVVKDSNCLSRGLNRATVIIELSVDNISEWSVCPSERDHPITKGLGSSNRYADNASVIQNDVGVA